MTWTELQGCTSAVSQQVAELPGWTLPQDEDPCHIFYTSGSSGRPKGCICTHKALQAYAQGKNDAHQICDSDVLLCASAHTFDPWIGDLASAMLAGALLVLPSQPHVHSSLPQLVTEHQATVLLTTPRLLVAWDAEQFESSLRIVSYGGEAMSEALTAAWLAKGGCELYNMYGLTEVQCWWMLLCAASVLLDDLDCTVLPVCWWLLPIALAASGLLDASYYTALPALMHPPHCTALPGLRVPELPSGAAPFRPASTRQRPRRHQLLACQSAEPPASTRQGRAAHLWLAARSWIPTEARYESDVLHHCRGYTMLPDRGLLYSGSSVMSGLRYWWHCDVCIAHCAVCIALVVAMWLSALCFECCCC